MNKKKVGETNYKQTAFGIIPRSKLIPLEIEGIEKAWKLIVKKHKNGSIPLTANFLKDLHKVGFGWIFPEFGGKFRRIEVTVSHHTPPKAYLIPALMEDLIKDIKTRLRYLPKITDEKFIEELVILLAWTHHRFLWIHPFQDYNGRIARLLISIILLNLNLPAIELKIETPKGRKKYVNALQEADQGNHKKLEILVREAIYEAARKVRLT